MMGEFFIDRFASMIEENFITALLLAYLMGSIPFGFLFSKIFQKHDIRGKGSGNIGATNVLRTSGKFLAALTLGCDILKGTWIPLFFKDFSWEQYLVLGATAILAHIFPLWLKFKGGKGVATALGVILSLHPYVALAMIGVFIATVFTWRYVSLGALIACASGIFWAFLSEKPFFPLWMLLMTLLMTYTHRENINRILKGKEHTLGGRKN
jgi:glycerol-3-phosphate acyltransferase PlsY